MKVRVAQTAGFCYGVSNAVDTVDRLLDEGRKVYTLGPIIHNEQVTGRLARRGAKIAETPADVTERDAVLVIRSHGVPQSVYDELNERGIEYVDATCPFVKKIHKIAAQISERGDILLLAGDPEHPEVVGITGYCTGEYYTFRNEEELLKILESLKNRENSNISVAAQTTFNVDLWKKCVKIIKKGCTNAQIFDTICKATQNRQAEAALLAGQCDVMLVIGDKSSSNTLKLCQICSEHCKTYRIDNAAGIPTDIADASVVGITAGASAPVCIIKEVQETMAEIHTNEESFEALLEASFKNSNTTGKVVEGTIVGINPNEVYVDVGRPQTGVCQLDQLTDNPNLTTDECVKMGDKLSFVIMRTNDQEGLIYLSKCLYDSAGAWDDIKNAAPKIVNRPRRRDDSDEDVFQADDEASAEIPQETVETNDEKAADPVVFSGVVTEVVKGGVIVSYKGVRVFIPAGQATLSRNEPLEGLLKKVVNFIVLEVNPSRRRAVGSIKAVLKKERRAQEKAFWENIEEGQIFKGSVKSFTDYGAFVDLGSVDGMIHITELSWTRIKHPSDVVKIGDVVEVFVKKVDKEKRRISLGYKKIEDNPWEILKVNYPVGTVIEAPVVGTPTFGAFVNILPGIDGLIHISQLSTSRVENPSDVVKVGDVVRAVITEVNLEGKRVSLSMRKLLEETAEADAAEETTEE